MLASLSEDTTLRLWEMENGNAIKSWGAHGGGGQSVQFTHDNRLVSCGRDRVAVAWDQNGSRLRAFDVLPDVAVRCCFTHDGARVVAGDWSGAVRVWESKDGKAVGNLLANPPGAAQRLEAAMKDLAVKQSTADQATAVLTASNSAVQTATTNLASAQKAVSETANALKAATDAAAKAKAMADAAPTLLKSAQEAATAKDVVAKAQGEAATKVKAAADAAKDNKALAEAAAKAKAMVDAAAAELTAAQKTLADMQVTAKTAADTLTKAQAAVPAAQAAAVRRRKTSKQPRPH